MIHKYINTYDGQPVLLQNPPFGSLNDRILRKSIRFVW